MFGNRNDYFVMRADFILVIVHDSILIYAVGLRSGSPHSRKQTGGCKQI